MKIKTGSYIETIRLGEKFSKVLKGGDVVILEGSLGGGKTTFVKGILKGLGFKKKVISPSFTLMHSYVNKNLEVYHIDLYRLKIKEIKDLYIEDFYSKKSIFLIEWGDKIKNIFSKYIKVSFIFLDENLRLINFYLKGYDREKIKSICN